MRRQVFKILLISAVLTVLILPLAAQAVNWWPIVPCGLNEPPPGTAADQRLPDSFYQPCTKCDLFRLIKNLIDMMTYLVVPVIGVAFIIWAGFKILISGASAAAYNEALKIIRGTLMGLAIVWGAWLVANTVIKTLAADSDVAENWFKFVCKEDEFLNFGGITLSPSPTVSATLTPTPSTSSGPTPTAAPSTSVSPSKTPTPSVSPQPGPLTITTSTLSDASQNSDYLQTIQATGGKAPYNWSVTGSLPAGLNINSANGEISGKPTGTGTFNFSVKVRDSSSPVVEVSRQLSLKVVAPASSVVISNVASSGVTQNSATITWTTDKPANSVVEYGTTTAYGPPVGTTSAQVTSHRVTITGLTPGTTYNYRAVSAISGFTARSSNNTFKTTGSTSAQTPTPSPSVSVSPSRTPIPSISVSPSRTPTPTVTAVATNCGDVNLVCSNTARRCPSLSTDPRLPPGRTSWTYLISEVAPAHPIRGVNTEKFLESIMRIETNGVLNKQSGSVPPSCGLMQIQADTANVFRTDCGVDHPITCEWLRGNDLKQGEGWETVARASICIAAEYARSIVGGSCYGTQGQVRDLAAGYNGGGGCNQNNNRDNALAKSKSCSSDSTANPKYENDCSNRPTLRYECLWDDYAHTTCNTGFNETRDYAAKFNACYN